jgi:hypothetical protein
MPDTEIQAFFKKWETQLKELEFILQYLHTYPEKLKAFKLEDLMTPDLLYKYQRDWLNNWWGLADDDRQFFQPHWVPVSLTSYYPVIDISDSNYPIFNVNYYFYDNRVHFKNILFHRISDLMLASEVELKNTVEHAYETKLIESLKDLNNNNE